MTQENQQILAQLPKPMAKARFTVLAVEDMVIPHPYCITPKHLALTDSMVLNAVTLAQAEARGATCATCRQLVRRAKQPEVLPFQQHEQQKVLLIEVDDNRKLKQIPELQAYLIRIKPLAEQLGIQGFAFPQKVARGHTPRS